MTNGHDDAEWDVDDDDVEILDEDYTGGAADESEGPDAGAYPSAGLVFDDAHRLLEAWAASAGVQDDLLVQDLATGLRERQDLTFWASVDLAEELPEPRVSRLLRSVARILIFVRNVAVFAPVGLTWWAISVVSPGFDEYITQRSLQGQDANFLQYWGQVDNTRFPSLSEDFFQIQEIAALGATIIVGIIFATLVAGILNSRVSRRTQLAFRQRDAVIIAIRRALHTAREATPESLAASLAESMTELLESSRLIIEAARRLEQASVGVSQLEPTFTSLNKQLETFDKRLGGTIASSVDRLGESVGELASLMDGSLRGLLAESVAGIDEVRDQLHRTAASVEFGTQQLLKDLASVPGAARSPRPSGAAVNRIN
jgi:predicted transcriptional regulator